MGDTPALTITLSSNQGLFHMAGLRKESLFVAVVCVFVGCTDSGNSHRIEPGTSQESAEAVYDAPHPDAALISMESDSLDTLIATPLKMSFPAESVARSPLIVQGKYKQIPPNCQIVTVQFFQEAPKHGRVITNEAVGQLIEKDGFWSFEIPVDLPATLGRQKVEVACHESGSRDSSSSAKSHVIAESDITVMEKSPE